MLKIVAMLCRHRAVVIITREVQGTSTNLALERRNLSCCLEKGHEGSHWDSQFEEGWQDEGTQLTHILRHESDELQQDSEMQESEGRGQPSSDSSCGADGE